MKLYLKWKEVTIFLCIVTVIFYGYFVEPYWIEVTRHETSAGGKKLGIRIVQISDLHIQKLGKKELVVLDEIGRAHV